MNTQIRLKYRLLWNEVGKVNPLTAVPQLGREYANAKVAQDASDRSSGPFGKKLGQAAEDHAALKAQTEAAAVCKHALNVPFGKFETTSRSLIIGFDVGGSTTDILCLVAKKLPGQGDKYGDTLIKESSIKFAAGRLAEATKGSTRFQEVLKSFCRKKKLFIHGVTVPPERLNSNTSAYYYNLIVDQLTSQADLNDFYQNLAANCPELFVVNSFMTGLIMFYAGQLACRVRTIQDESPADYQESFSDVMIGFFGKGGRMFDWLRAVNEDAATDYYSTCFATGYGMNASDHITGFSINHSDPKYVKAEVSFGLSAYGEIVATKDQISEVIGEEGYSYNGAPIDSMSAVEGRFLQNFGNQFSTPREFKRFREFAQIFSEFAKEYFGFDIPTLTDDVNGMRLKSYIESIPEYQLAKRAQEFDFEAPIIILEGMCFLDTVLEKRLFTQ